MNYMDAVEARIAGSNDEMERRRELWRHIVEEYETGGEDTVKKYLDNKAETIAEGLSDLIEVLQSKF